MAKACLPIYIITMQFKLIQFHCASKSSIMIEQDCAILIRSWKTLRRGIIHGNDRNVSKSSNLKTSTTLCSSNVGSVGRHLHNKGFYSRSTVCIGANNNIYPSSLHVLPNLIPLCLEVCYQPTELNLPFVVVDKVQEQVQGKNLNLLNDLHVIQLLYAQYGVVCEAVHSC